MFICVDVGRVCVSWPSCDFPSECFTDSKLETDGDFRLYTSSLSVRVSDMVLS